MKKLFNFLKNHPIYCLIIIICVVFLPGAIIAKPQAESKLIIRALGIDKSGDEYQVSAIAFLPKASQSFQENYKIVEGKGRTLYDAVSAAAKETGKDIGLAHTGIVFVNDEICQEGLVESIDFLVRDYSLGNDTYVVYVPESTKELVEAVDWCAVLLPIIFHWFKQAYKRYAALVFNRIAHNKIKFSCYSICKPKNLASFIVE